MELTRIHPAATAKGCIYSVHILNAKDLNRQLVKSNTCTITIPEISLTLPASRGQLTNVEGLVSDIVRDLSLDQPVRKIMDPATHDKIETLLNRLKECLDDDDDEATTGEKPEKTFTPFTLKLDDPSGNSYVQFFGTTSDARTTGLANKTPRLVSLPRRKRLRPPKRSPSVRSTGLDRA
jgi:zinc finger protein